MIVFPETAFAAALFACARPAANCLNMMMASPVAMV
jgi:hypothetical protein